MHISRPGFAGELRDSGGILTKYDDIGCMMLDLPRAGDLPEAWVEDYAGGGFVPLDDATLVRTETLETPMGYGVFAFENIADAHAFAAGNAGSTVRVDDLLRDVRQSGSVAGRSKDG
jgi:copper chaperone NosL